MDEMIPPCLLLAWITSRIREIYPAVKLVHSCFKYEKVTPTVHQFIIVIRVHSKK